MSQEILYKHRQIWRQKSVLRLIYQDYYRRIVSSAQPGPTLEIGGGSGNLKDYAANVVSTDIVPLPWLDAATDAQALAFADDSFANVVAVDVLHHLEYPVRFLAEAQRVLRPGGRLILLEPAISPFSWVIYSLFHPEPVEMRANPLQTGSPDPSRRPFDSNQAIPTLLFGRHRDRLEAMFPTFKLETFTRLSFFAYPLSGGFRAWSLLPAAAAPILLSCEQRLQRFLGPLMAFRLFVVMKKYPSADQQVHDPELPIRRGVTPAQ
jgi:SAM-dependent methyltransferase